MRLGGMDRLLSACSNLRDEAAVRSQAPFPRMAALSLTGSSSENRKVRRKHLCEHEERCGDEQLGSGLHHGVSLTRPGLPRKPRLGDPITGFSRSRKGKGHRVGV